MRGSTAELVRAIGKDFLKDRKKKWNINPGLFDVKPVTQGSHERRHWPHQS